MPYHAFERLYHYRDRYFLFVDKLHAYILPEDRFVVGDSADFRAFIEAKTGQNGGIYLSENQNDNRREKMKFVFEAKASDYDLAAEQEILLRHVSNRKRNWTRAVILCAATGRAVCPDRRIPA